MASVKGYEVELTMNESSIQALEEVSRMLIGLNCGKALEPLKIVVTAKGLSSQHDFDIQVTLTHGPRNVKPQMKLTDDNGYFCFEVPPGEYRISAIAATPATTPDLVFLPPHIDFNVSGLLLSLKFYKAQVDVRGSVTCKEKCDSSVSVALVRLDAKINEDKLTARLTDQSSEFLFQNVLPGKYALEVKHEATDGEDKWCWEQSSVAVNIGTEDVKGIHFVQKGYWVNLVSTHDVEDAYLLHQSDGSRVNLKIKMNCAHLENCLHEAREEAQTHLCAADRKASEYTALRLGAR